MALLVTVGGCASSKTEIGVENRWRDETLPVFEKGRTTESDVMKALGPPSQVIGLKDRTLFYYLREQSVTRGLYLIIYNETREKISYDRAIFFFDTEGVLTDFAYSEEKVPRAK